MFGFITCLSRDKVLRYYLDQVGPRRRLLFLDEYHELFLGPEPAHNVLMSNPINAMVAGSDTTRAGLIALFYLPVQVP